jgi:predicted AAA+ superfamily ATPase
MKEVLKEILTEFYRSPLPTVFHREVNIEDLPRDVRKARVFIGMRRSGKTFLMYQDMHKKISSGMEKEKILYLNFEDDRLSGFKTEDFQTILDVYYQLYPHLIEADDLSFYFDEIQNVEGWEKFIRRLLDKEKMAIFITGSSAKLLSKEIATSLRGRCLENEVFPLSFPEYLAYQGIDKSHSVTSKEKALIRHHCDNYLRRGGFPEPLSLPDNLYPNNLKNWVSTSSALPHNFRSHSRLASRQWSLAPNKNSEEPPCRIPNFSSCLGIHYQTIQSYINSAVFRDVIERHQLKRPHIVKLFLIHCLQNIASPLSITKVYNTFKSRGEELSRSTLYEYLHYFEDAYLICGVPIFEFSVRIRQVNPSKIYCIDSGIISGYSIKPDTEYSSRLENSVYIQLRRIHFENIFYYKTKSGKEVDFIAQYPNGQIELYQVSVTLSDEGTRQREIAALVEAGKELGINQAYIITSDTDEIVELDTMTIQIIPYWKWSLFSDS